MAYKILKQLIQNKQKTNQDLLNMADVYYAAGRLDEEEYKDIIQLISIM